MTAEGLVGDIGGTHARFALAGAEDGAIREPRTFANKDFASLEAVIEAYLSQTSAAIPAAAVLAVAGPVTNGAIRFTNLDWEISEDRLRREAGFGSARLINDFAAQARGAPLTPPSGLRRIGPEVPGDEGAALAVLGPGTGFGVAALAREAGIEIVLSTEGGHAGFAPTDDVEVEIWRLFMKRRPRVSIERVLSGRGLFELYGALAEIRGEPASLPDQLAVQGAADRGDPLAIETIERFCMILGATAGDIALGLGARRGVYVTGGVAQGLSDWIARGDFRRRFEAKGRFETYLQAIPTWLIMEPYTALIGAATVLKRLEAEP
jgi:glucokinase